MNKFELKVLKRELKQYDIVNAFCLETEENFVYTLFIVYMHRDHLFCSKFNLTFGGNRRPSYNDLKNRFEIILQRDIPKIDHFILSDSICDTEVVNSVSEIRRFNINLSSFFYVCGIFKGQEPIYSYDLFEEARKILERLDTASETYIKLFESNCLKFKDLADINIEALTPVIKKEVYE